MALYMRSQHQRIHEEPDQSLCLATATTGDGRPDDNVGLSAPAGQNGLICRQAHHEERRPFRPSQLAESRRQLDRNPEPGYGPFESLYWRTSPIRWELQLPHVLETFPPIRQLFLQKFSTQP